MRLLIDELYSPGTARQLRDLGHDVIAVKEESSLESLADEALFAVASEQRRAIVTENLAHFRPLQEQAVREERTSYGLVCVSPSRFPRSKATIPLMVRALDHFLKAHPDEGALVEQGEYWLQEPDE